MNRNAIPRSARRAWIASASVLAVLAAGASSFSAARAGARTQCASASERVVFLARDARGELGWRAAECDGYWSPWRAREASPYVSVDVFAAREASFGERAPSAAPSRVAVDGVDTTGYVDPGLADSR